MSAERLYRPENWKPLERWLPESLCRRQFDWMWREGQVECYRCRESGQLLFLDQLGQCFEETEVGAMAADFQQRYQRCTGTPYSHKPPARLSAYLSLEGRDDDEEDEEEDEDEITITRPPNGATLFQIVNEWSVESQLEPAKREALLSELRVFHAIFLSELEMQCRHLLNTAQCWLE